MAAILKWMFVLALLLLVAGGGAAYWIYARSDEGLRILLLEQLKTVAPELRCNIARAQFDPVGCKVRIFGLTAYLPDDEIGQPSLEVPEIVATLDSDPLTNFNGVVIQNLHVVKPKLHLIRFEDGRWDWLQTSFKPMESTSAPKIEVDNGTIVARIDLPQQRFRELRFDHFEVTARPMDAEHLGIRVGAFLGSSRLLMLEVDAALNGSTWQCKTYNLWRIPLDRKLIQLFCDLSPQIASQVAQLGQLLDKTKALQAPHNSSAARPSATDSTKSVVRETPVPDFGAQCEFDLRFRIQKPGQNLPLNFDADIEIANGEINNSLLPISLTKLGGKIHVDDHTIVLKDLEAANGETSIEINGDMLRNKPISVSAKLRGVELNGALKSRLPTGLRRVAQSLGLMGICNADVAMMQTEQGWDYNLDLHLTNGAVTHERFPLTVRDVSGDLTIQSGALARGPTGAWMNQGGTLTFHGTGHHAGQTLKADGVFHNLGPAQDAQITIKGENLPVDDDQSLAACPEMVRRSIMALNLKGRHDFLLMVNRRGGMDQKWEPKLIEAVHDASMNFVNFPGYEIQQLQGKVVWNGDLVEFNELAGTHDGAILKGEGAFNRRGAGPGLLKLKINAQDATFDRALENALPKILQQTWDQFQPQGRFDATTWVTWVPGTPCIIQLPDVKVRNGRITMRCFPWSMQNLVGQFAYNMDPDKPGRLDIKNVSAQHESTQLCINEGIGWFSAWDPWKLEFKQLDIVNLRPDTVLRKALPDALQRTFDVLQPTGVYSLQGPVAFSELRGQTRNIEAIWNLKTTLSDCSIRAGSRIDNINGEVQLAGKWDGNDAIIMGDLDLDSLWMFRQPSPREQRGYQFTQVRGPILYRDHKFIAGMEPSKLIPKLLSNPDPKQRISANFIKGTVYLDTDVNLDNGLDYRTFVELKGGQLEDFAKQYVPSRSKLGGVLNGWMQLQGQGEDPDQMRGRGKLLIAPAALYDSPFFAQLIEIASFQIPKQAAFDQAEINFNVANSRFDLNQIDLRGDSLSMRGRGYVRFDGGMQMDFGVYLRQLLSTPNSMTYPISVVEVTGTVGNPQLRNLSMPNLDRGLQQFFGAFDRKNMASPANLFAPLLGARPDAPVN